jgi:hypothetical protein
MRNLLLVATLGLGLSLSLYACSGNSTKLGGVGSPCIPQPDGGSDQCADKLCLQLETNSGICTKSCATNHLCPDGFTCDTAGQFGLVCQRATGCKTDDDCPAGHVCDQTTDTCYIKVSRELCSPCEDTLQCPQGGSCFVAKGSGERFCTAPCNSDGSCPPGFQCQSLPDNGPTNQCVPVTESCNFGKPLCAPCKGDNECGNYLDLCVRNVVSGEQFCGTQCAPSRNDCPSAFHCEDLSGADAGPFQCVPDSRTCQGYCDSTDEHTQTIECGLGRSCDTSANQCQPATDGRQCSPCQTNDDCAKGQHSGNECILNADPNSQYNGETFCAEPCPAGDGGTQQCVDNLGLGFNCMPIGNESFCIPARGTCTTGLGELGDNCSANLGADCVTGVCLVAGLGSICSATCTQDAQCNNDRYHCCLLVDLGQATDGGGDQQVYDCTQRNSTDTGPANNGMGVCAPLGGSFGDDCSPGRPPCASGACLDLGTAELCTDQCPDGSTCPPNFTCEPATQGDLFDGGSGDSINVCFPQGGGVVGSDCTFGPAACADRLCIQKDSGNVCTKACDGGISDCPTGYDCEATILVGSTATNKTPVCIPPTLQ